MYGSNSVLSIQVDWSICLSLGKHHIVLIIVALNKNGHQVV